MLEPQRIVFTGEPGEIMRDGRRDRVCSIGQRRLVREIDDHVHAGKCPVDGVSHLRVGSGSGDQRRNGTPQRFAKCSQIGRRSFCGNWGALRRNLPARNGCSIAKQFYRIAGVIDRRRVQQIQPKSAAKDREPVPEIWIGGALDQDGLP